MKAFPRDISKLSFQFILIFAVFKLLSSCTPINSVTVRNYSSLYKSSNSEGLLSARTFHLNDSVSRVYIKILTNNIDSNFLSGVSISTIQILTFKSIEATKPFDSAVYNFEALNFKLYNDFLLGQIDLKIPKGTNYQAEVSLNNFAHLEKLKNLFSLNKTDSIGQLDILIVDDASKLPIINDYIFPNQTIHFEYSKRINQDFKLKLFDRDFSLALPPFGINNHKTFDYIPDSIINISFTNGISNSVQLNRPGIYHLEMDAISRNGSTCFLFNASYPTIENIEQLIYPLRYVTSKSEYQSILESENQKGAIDKFWLARAGNEAKARKMIKEFYSRVEKSNRLFSSYNEGWKTDRGMIYLVYGPPTNTYRNDNFETWIYGFEGTQYSITFNFTKVDNPFTTNDYMLNRSSMYKTSWYQAVESWREGRVLINE